MSLGIRHSLEIGSRRGQCFVALTWLQRRLPFYVEVLADGIAVFSRHCNLRLGSQCANQVVSTGPLNRGEGYVATGLTQWIVRRNRATRGMRPWLNIPTNKAASGTCAIVRTCKI